jgi:hypothetical protein
MAGGGIWVGKTSLGAVDANATTSDGGTFRLFATSSELQSMPALEGRAGVRLGPIVSAEGVVSYGPSEVRTDVRFDVEGAPDVTATEPVRQFALEAIVVTEIAGWRVGSRTTPFVSGGVGYIRQVHEEGTLVEEGTIYRAGGGVNYVLRAPRSAGVQPTTGRGTIGIRADIRAVVRTGGLALTPDASVAPAFGASLFFRF